MSTDTTVAPTVIEPGDVPSDTVPTPSVPPTPIHDELATRLGIRATTGGPVEKQDVEA